MSYPTRSSIEFSDRELVDLAAAWVALSVAFALLLRPIHRGGISPADFVATVGLSFVTVGVAFLLHELAHKVVAVRFGQTAEFRADYGMLFLAIVSALVGFLFAAPGAVYHRGRITVRENGLIALAGPVTNIGLAAAFLPLVVVPGLGAVGHLGVLINLFLAAFNMLPYGPLDGKSVWRWDTSMFIGVFVPSVVALVAAFLVLGFP
ncbi:metalloprotease [Salinilacihabitans rarus]|uniref:metalloprotease n=1 Tax=Salinilacihabitans rarus TaxID=2961596 RepID=UPI0020C9218D|nr:metalloprotease [Salinilacihabitans rarus]